MFQKISYLIDLRRGDRHIYGFLDFCMFVTFFPQLIAGPLVRHNEIIHQFRARSAPAGDVGEPVARLRAVRDRRGEEGRDGGHAGDGRRSAVRQGDRHASLSAAEAWIGAPPPTRCRSISTSPAIPTWRSGLALMFGLRLPMNFNAPYRAVSIRDFWRRWHMTLSRFLRDYLYIPLGGNRCGAGAPGGECHRSPCCSAGCGTARTGPSSPGAGCMALALAVNHVWQGAGLRLPRIVAWALTLLFVMACWVLFRSPPISPPPAMCCCR